MKIGINNIESSQYGMPPLHMEALREAAKELGGPIGVRPVSVFALTYLEEGNPTKPFNIKNKSANTGPAAGLIAVESLYSRLPALSEDEKKLPQAEQTKLLKAKQKELQRKYDKDIVAARNGDEFKASNQELKSIDLKLTLRRLQELVTLDSSLKMEELQNSDYRFKLTWGDKNNLREAYCRQDADNTFSVFDKNGAPIKILGRTLPNSVEKGITADYDLLVYCPPYATFQPGGVDKTPFRTQGLTSDAVDKNAAAVKLAEKEALPNNRLPLTGRGESWSRRMQEAVSALDEKAVMVPKNKPPQESVKGGNWSERVQEAVSTINDVIRRKDPIRNERVLNTVHHNAEFNNPFADDLKNNLPCLFVLPKVMDLSMVLIATQRNPDVIEIERAKTASVILVESVTELNSLRNVLRDKGYYWPSHARYSGALPPFRPEIMQMLADKPAPAADQPVIRTSQRSSTSLIFQSVSANPVELLKKEAKQTPAEIDRVTFEKVDYEALKMGVKEVKEAGVSYKTPIKH